MDKYYIGIDPGSYKLGWCILKKEKDKIKRIDSGNLIIGQEPIGNRLSTIYDEIYVITRLITEREINKATDIQMILEDYFVKSYKGAKVISQVHGVVLLAAYNQDIDVCYITPTRIKKVICGNGKATKEDVKNEIVKGFNLKHIPSDDESDAMAVAWAYIKGETNGRNG
jgi:crossover junction endodeoxyribonuclease RuvC